MTTTLDLLYLESHSCYNLVLADVSTYETGFNIVSPTIQITMPFGSYITLPFTARSVNIYNSGALGITCDDEELVPLPDGIYRFKYTVNPASQYFVEKSVIRVDQIQEKFDNAFLKLDLDCNSTKQDMKILDNINYLIQEPMAAANKCATDLSIKMYRMASAELDKFNNNQCS